ncbi:MAG: hypothetical protein H0T71_11145, partial [Acidobacteria bacterium]|nr:hypothetical protein [Acidobacteriota bacterium]
MINVAAVATAGPGKQPHALAASPRLALMVASAVGGLTTWFRLAAMTSFSNDHFVHLSVAQQWLLGDWPLRDFADPGMPLMYAASAGAQWLGGPTLLSEAVLVAAAFGVSAA